MEQQVISLNKGIRRNPTMSGEGELTECMDMYVKDGELKRLPKVQETGIEIEGMLMAVHKVNDKENYITYNGTNLMYQRDGETKTIGIDDVVAKVDVFGQVLVVTTDKGIEYAIWRDGEYVVLGNELPMLDVDFRLRGKVESDSLLGQIKLNSKNLIDSMSYELSEIQTNVAYQQFPDETTSIGVFHSWGATITLTYPIEAEQVKVEESPVDEQDRWKRDISVQYEGDEHFTHVGWDNFDGAKYTYAFRTKKKITKIRVTFGYYHFGGSGYASTFYIYKGIVDKKINIDNTVENFVAASGFVKKFINEHGTEKNRFINPFFARMALRLFDGTYVKMTAPCIMQANIGRSPLCVCPNVVDNNTKDVDMVATAMVCDLQFAINNKSNLLTNISRWRDIVDKVVIAVTPPLYRYDMSQEYDATKSKISIEAISHKDSVNNDYSVAVTGEGDESEWHSTLVEHITQIEGQPTPTLQPTYRNIFNLPEFSTEDENKAVLERGALFYAIKEYSFDDFVAILQSEERYVDVQLSQGTLKSLTGHELVTDGSILTSNITPNVLTAYNNRLIFADVKESLIEGYNPSQMMATRDKGASTSYITPTLGMRYYKSCKMSALVKIKDGMQNKQVYCSLGNNNIQFPIWFFYPDSRAIEANVYVCIEDGFNNYHYYKANILLKEHTGMNGAYWFNNYNQMSFDYTTLSAIESEIGCAINEHLDKAVIVDTNKIMQSRVANPFVLDNTLTRTVGNGEIRNLTAVTMALSQDQHGQSPMIALCSDGIWSLGVSSNGALESRQAVSRDVILPNSQVLQVDDAIVFITKRGVMMLGANGIPQCISEAINNTEFINDIQGARMTWDASNMLIRIYPIDGAEHYVMSRENGEWSMASEGYPNSVVASYPTSYLQYNEKLCKYDTIVDVEERGEGYIVTRETSLGDPYAMKMLQALRVSRKGEYYIDKEGKEKRTVKVKVEVSNDRLKWRELKSLNSRSYKWYRFSIDCNLNYSEGLEGIVCGIDTRREGKMR